ncbi:MAG: DUF4213 domain-containing protein [bacterium]
MQILDDVISTLDFDAPVRDVRLGVFHTGVLTRHCGLASTLPRNALQQKAPLVKEPGFLCDKSAQELTQLAYSESILEAAVGMAALNSLLEVDEAATVELNAADLILKRGEGRKVAIIGHFPFVPKVSQNRRPAPVVQPRRPCDHAGRHDSSVPRFIRLWCTRPGGYQGDGS